MPKKDEEAVETPTPSLSRKADAGVCGHENKHFKGDHKMTCTLPKGHEPVAVEREVLDGGVLRMRTTYEVIHQAPYRMTKHGVTRDAVASWSDEAGKPPHK